MDAQDIIELIEYFRNLQNNEMKFEIEELRGKRQVICWIENHIKKIDNYIEN